jgi:small-conductance mechanosensitive channel
MYRLGFLALFALLAWLTHIWASGLNLFETSFLPGVLHGVAVGSSAALAALLASAIILDLALRRGLKVEPNGAQRVVVHAIFAFAALAVAMNVLGSDIAGLLTTSALLTAIIGFALQPTLGGLFSGVALQLDRHLKPGSYILFDGVETHIESMNWRSVIGLRRDNVRVVIPNSKLADEALRLRSEDQPAEQETFFYAPVSIPPQRVSKLVRELVGDLSYVVGSQTVQVAPVEQMPEIAALKYRVRYNVAFFMELRELEGEVLRRIWYGFQRHDIPLPVSRLYSEDLRARQTGPLGYPEGYNLTEAVQAALTASDLAPAAATIAQLTQRVEDEGRVLLYGPSEKIVIPSAWADRRYLLAAGELCQDDPNFADRRHAGATRHADSPQLFVHKLADNAMLMRVADELSVHIGPYAEHAIRRETVTAADYTQLCDRLALEIDDLDARSRFLATVLGPRRDMISPGLIFSATRDVSGQTVSSPHYRAADEAVIIAIPTELAGEFRDKKGSKS